MSAVARCASYGEIFNFEFQVQDLAEACPNDREGGHEFDNT